VRKSKTEKFGTLSRKKQTQAIQSAASGLKVPDNDRYLHHYPLLLKGIADLLPLDISRLSLAGSAVFSWMPTQMNLDHRGLKDSLNVINNLPNQPLSQKSLELLASTFATIGGKSVVAASKVLHFIYPQEFPIFDRIIAQKIGMAPNGGEAAASYLNYLEVLSDLLPNEDVVSACNEVRRRLSASGYFHEISDMRAVELILFISPAETLA
jgi:hypothetical protein